MQLDDARRERRARADDHAARLGFEAHHVKRLAGGDLQALPLSDREVDDALMAAQHAARQVDDIARRPGVRPQTLDDIGIAAGRNETDVLAVLLLGDRKTKFARKLAHPRLRKAAKRETQHFELLARRGEQEVALVALTLFGAMERVTTVSAEHIAHVVAGRGNFAAKL